MASSDVNNDNRLGYPTSIDTDCEKLIRDFLRQFTLEHPSTEEFNEDVALPMSIGCYYLAYEEVEGYCLDWSSRYLNTCSAPEIVRCCLSRTATDDILTKDLSDFHEIQLVELDSAEADDVTYPLLARKVACMLLNTVNEYGHKWNKDIPDIYASSFLMETYEMAIKNKRKKMEDKHLVLNQFNTLYNLQDMPSLSFFGIYDGHGGADAANYSYVHLHTNMARNSKLKDDIHAALKESFEKTDEQFGNKCKQENLHSGTTAVVAVVSPHTLYISWLGDSQVVLCRNGKAVVLMEPHKPEREDEKARIEALGGCVVFFGAWRVNGTLSVSRAIGDNDHKPYVSSTPDTSEFPLEGSEDYILLACDGLWDVISAEEAVEYINEYLNQPDSKRENIPELIIDLAVERGSNDNISVVISFFPIRVTHVKETPSSNNKIEVSDAATSQKLKSEDDIEKTNQTDRTGPENVTLIEKDKDNGKDENNNQKGLKENSRTQPTLQPIVFGYSGKSTSVSYHTGFTEPQAGTKIPSPRPQRHSTKLRPESYTISVLDSLSINARNKTTMKASIIAGKGKSTVRKPIVSMQSNNRTVSVESKSDPMVTTRMLIDQQRMFPDPIPCFSVTIKPMSGTQTMPAPVSPRQLPPISTLSPETNIHNPEQHNSSLRRLSMPSRIEDAMQVSKMEASPKTSPIPHRRSFNRKSRSLKR